MEREARRGELLPAEAANAQYTHLFKVIVAGRAGVGKSSLVRRWNDDVFQTDMKSTIGCDFINKTLRMENGRCVKVQFWDTAGQERYARVMSSYYRGAHALVFVFSLTHRESFEGVQQLLDEIDEGGASVAPDAHAFRVLVGNKCDLQNERAIRREEALALVEMCGLDYYAELSAKDAPDVVWEFCYGLTTQLYARYESLADSGTVANADLTSSLEAADQRIMRALTTHARQKVDRQPRSIVVLNRDGSVASSSSPSPSPLSNTGGSGGGRCGSCGGAGGGGDEMIV